MLVRVPVREVLVEVVLGQQADLLSVRLNILVRVRAQVLDEFDGVATPLLPAGDEGVGGDDGAGLEDADGGDDGAFADGAALADDDMVANGAGGENRAGPDGDVVP